MRLVSIKGNLILQGGAKVIIRCCLAVIFFLMKNFKKLYCLCLFGPLEFFSSSREYDIVQVAAATVDNHSGPF
jgi:hypothetical protein